MESFIKFLKEIFMLEEDNSSVVGISCFKESETIEKPDVNITVKPKATKELKLSELMRKNSSY